MAKIIRQAESLKIKVMKSTDSLVGKKVRPTNDYAKEFLRDMVGWWTYPDGTFKKDESFLLSERIMKSRAKGTIQSARYDGDLEIVLTIVFKITYKGKKHIYKKYINLDHVEEA